jgi:hypothetical protein
MREVFASGSGVFGERFTTLRSHLSCSIHPLPRHLKANSHDGHIVQAARNFLEDLIEVHAEEANSELILRSNFYANVPN